MNQALTLFDLGMFNANNINRSEESINITINRKALLHSLVLAQSLVERRTNNPFSNVKLEAQSHSLIITSKSNEIFFEQTLLCVIKSQGITTIDGITLLNVIKKMYEDEVNIIQVGQQLLVHGKQCSFKLGTIPADDKYDYILLKNPNASFKILGAELVKLLKYTKFAMLNNELRYNLNGILIESDEQRITCAATDGHRLGVNSTNKIQDLKGTFRITLPAKLIEELSRIFSDELSALVPIDIDVSENKIQFRTNGILLISKLISENFPDYKKLLPNLNNYKFFNINAKMFSDVVDRVTAVTMDKLRAVKLEASKTHLQIFAYGEGKGSGEEMINVSNNLENMYIYEHPQSTLVCNARYLLDVLSLLPSNTILQFYLKDDVSACVLKADQLPESTFLIMPIRL